MWHGEGRARRAVGADVLSAEEGGRPVIGHCRPQVDAGEGIPEETREGNSYRVRGPLCHQPCTWRHPGPRGPSLWAQRRWATEAARRDRERQHLQGQLTPNAPLPATPTWNRQPSLARWTGGGRNPTASPHLPRGWKPAFSVPRGPESESGEGATHKAKWPSCCPPGNRS